MSATSALLQVVSECCQACFQFLTLCTFLEPNPVQGVGVKHTLNRLDHQVTQRHWVQCFDFDLLDKLERPDVPAPDVCAGGDLLADPLPVRVGLDQPQSHLRGEGKMAERQRVLSVSASDLSTPSSSFAATA